MSTEAFVNELPDQQLYEVWVPLSECIITETEIENENLSFRVSEHNGTKYAVELIESIEIAEFVKAVIIGEHGDIEELQLDA